MKQTISDQQKQLLAAVSQTFDNDLTALDQSVEHELDLIRHKAIERAENKAQPTRFKMLLRSLQQTLRDLYTPTMVGGGLAALLALFIYADIGINSLKPNTTAMANSNDDILLYEWVLDDKSVDFYQQLAFVEWLDEEGQLLVADS